MKTQTTAAKAFITSEGKKFAGQILEPFTPERQSAACEMGLKAGSVSRYREQYFFRDTILTLWLCSIPSTGAGDWTVKRCLIEPDEAAEAAHAWAARMGISLLSPAFREARLIFIAIIDEQMASRGEPIVPNGPAGDIDSGEL